MSGLRLPPTPRAPRLGRSARIVAFYASVAVAAVFWGALRGHANVFVLDGAGRSFAQLLSSVALGVALGLLLVLLTRELQERYAWARMLHNEFRHLLGQLSRREIWLLAASSAIGEECLFRGALLLHLRSTLPGTAGDVLGIAGSSLVFALLHIGPGARFLSWTVSALLLGVLLAVIYIGMGDLLAPIAIHFTINLLNMQDIIRRKLAE